MPVGGRDVTAEDDAAGGDLDAGQHVVEPGSLGDRVDQASRWVVDGGSGDAERVDAAARQAGQRYRGAQVRVPGNPPVRGRQPVHSVAFGGGDDEAANHQGLAVHRPVEVT